jgi:hypothetical protein
MRLNLSGCCESLWHSESKERFCKIFVESSWNVMAHGEAREGKWPMVWVASTLHTTSEHGVSSITTTDAHTSAVSNRLNWRPSRFKWTRPFLQKDDIWFLRVCHHVSNAVYYIGRGLQHLKSCYNRGGACLLRGTNWSFVYNDSLIFTFKECNGSSLPPRRSRFVPRLVHLRFMVDKVTVGQNFSPRSSVCPYSFRCSIHLHLFVAVAGKRERDEVGEPSKKSMLFWQSGYIV